MASSYYRTTIVIVINDSPDQRTEGEGRGEGPADTDTLGVSLRVCSKSENMPGDFLRTCEMACRKSRVWGCKEGQREGPDEQQE